MFLADGLRSHSQHGEDLALLELLPESASKWFVDVGANDGFSWSNSYLFGKLGFNLLLVEPMPDYASKCRSLWSENPNVIVELAAISGVEGPVDFFINEDKDADLLAMRSSILKETIPSTLLRKICVHAVPLSTLLSKHQIPTNLAVLSVDAEGMDLQVLKSAALEIYRPALLCIEDEMNLDEISSFTRSKGYVGVRRLGPNGIYLAEEYSRA